MVSAVVVRSQRRIFLEFISLERESNAAWTNALGCTAALAAPNRGQPRAVTVTVTRSSFRPCPRCSSGRPPAPYVLCYNAMSVSTERQCIGTRCLALLRFLHLRRGSQGCAKPTRDSFDVLTVPTHALDLIQDLYIKELKAYKPAAQVRNLYADKVCT